MAAKLSELTMNDLLVIQRTGIDVDNFMRYNELYVNHIRPALEHKREQAVSDGEWTPVKTTDAGAAIAFNAFNSGLRVGLKGIEGVCLKIYNRGLDAAKEIERRKKNEKQKAG